MEAVALPRSALRTHGHSLSLAESIPPTPPHLERRRLRGVEHIEPNDEIGQRPAVLSLPSLAAIGWIILKRFGRSGPRLEKMRWMRRAGNWVVITPRQLSILRAPLQLLWGRECGRAYQRPRRKDILVLVRQSMSDFTEAIKDWPMQNDIP